MSPKWSKFDLNKGREWFLPGCWANQDACDDVKVDVVRNRLVFEKSGTVVSILSLDDLRSGPEAFVPKLPWIKG